jgi:5-methylcytosine-specific restriction endonuclease McrA
MSQVFVLDTNKQPLNPVHPGQARRFLTAGKAAVYRIHPFTIILKRTVPAPVVEPLRLKIDPGSKTTGLALVNDGTGVVVWAAELHHRGSQIKEALDRRRALRQTRRHRKTRHRPRRFQNRRRKAGWLPPSLMSRVANVQTWVARLRRLALIEAISLELVKFDTQRMQNPAISGVAYQQGELAGYEVKEYLLEKWGRRCTYCGATGVPLQVEHIVPRRRGGTNRVSNLTLACAPCNQAKGTQTAAEFGYPQIRAQAQQPLKDAAAMNTTRNALYEWLQTTGLSIEIGSGGLTKFNRARHGLPKTHWLDAACVGTSTPNPLRVAGVQVLQIRAMGHGRRQMCRTDKYGFPCQHKARRVAYFGFRTGDLVRAVVPHGKYAGTYTGRVAVRARGQFRIATVEVHHAYCRRLQQTDGYQYAIGQQPGCSGRIAESHTNWRTPGPPTRSPRRRRSGRWKSEPSKYARPLSKGGLRCQKDSPSRPRRLGRGPCLIPWN